MRAQGMPDSKAKQTIQRARALRQAQTPTETKLWRRLRAGQLCGFKFRRQFPVGRYIADFCCVEAKLIIEIDGDTHFGRDAQDAERARHINELGYAVIRVFNEDVRKNHKGVLEYVLAECEKRRDMLVESR